MRSIFLTPILRSVSSTRIFCLATLLLSLQVGGLGTETARSQTIRRIDLSTDPLWQGYRNRLTPDQSPTIRQDFGWSPTRQAGGQRRGEIGGHVQRALRPARYAFRLPKPLSLDDRLDASGRFAVSHDSGSSGVLIGWFHGTSAGWRTPNSIAFRVDGNGGNYWLFFEYGTRRGRTAGKGVFAGERYQTTKTPPFLADGTSHPWRLQYDPSGNGGHGLIRFTVDHQTFELPMRQDDRKDGAEFEFFGIWNQETTGGGMDFWLDDLEIHGESYSFDEDPSWIAVGNRVTYRSRTVRPFHDFGYRPTAIMNNKPGATGGVIWRDERPSYYADRIDRLTLNDQLVAQGKIKLVRAAADSAVHIGWFDSAAKRGKSRPDHEQRLASQLSILVEGPSRIGHYVRPTFATASGAGQVAESGPVLRPDGKVHTWQLSYHPTVGNGEITVSLDAQKKRIRLTKADREQGAIFDRFGIFNMQSGGWHVEFYLSDLSYTAGR